MNASNIVTYIFYKNTEDCEVQYECINNDCHQ